MKKFSKILFIILITITLNGCKTKNTIYNIEDDFGDIIDISIAEIFNETKYITLTDIKNNKNLTITNVDEINTIIKTIKESKKKKSNERNLVGTTINLQFLNNKDELIAKIDLYLSIDDKQEYGYIDLKMYNNNFDLEDSFYYINNKEIKKVLENYIQI